MTWIKCSEQMPEASQRCAVFVPEDEESGYLDHFTIADYDPSTEAWDGDSCAMEDGLVPTHWMPLDKPQA